MGKIKKDSREFKNFKEVVERNKLRDSGTDIDKMVQVLKENNIMLSKTI